MSICCDSVSRCEWKTLPTPSKVFTTVKSVFCAMASRKRAIPRFQRIWPPFLPCRAAAFKRQSQIPCRWWSRSFSPSFQASRSHRRSVQNPTAAVGADAVVVAASPSPAEKARPHSPPLPGPLLPVRRQRHRSLQSQTQKPLPADRKSPPTAAGTTVVVPGRAEIAVLRRRKSPKLSKRTRAKRSGASSLCCGKTEASHKEAEQTNSARRKNARLSAPLALTAVSAATAAVRLPASGTHIAALPVPGLHRDSRTIPALAVRPLLPQVVYSRCSVYRAFCTENPWTKLRMSFQYPTPRSPYS